MAVNPGERLRLIRGLFDDVLDLPPAERTARLSSVEPSLRSAVEKLLESSANAGELAPISAKGGGTPVAGHQLGNYRLVRVIGTGGMASIFEARRTSDGARVAIKVIRAGLVRDVTLRRFRQEQWILDSLAHPNIATLVDTGVRPDGRPFLVMEYIEGEPITAWCDASGLGLAQRIALFRQVCGAVDHVHGQGILHRDLKPANILVANGSVKLLDFGIAKLLQEEPALEAIRTSLGSRALTPEYASPEQIEGVPLDARTDIYSLSVVLFELLTRHIPHEPRGESLLEYTARVRAEPILAPSTVREHAGGEELDRVVLKALARQPADRYRSARQFSEALATYG